MKTEYHDMREFEKVGPGLYRDRQTRALHLMIPELLDHFGYADTPENRDVATKAALDAWQQAYPNANVAEWSPRGRA